MQKLHDMSGRPAEVDVVHARGVALVETLGNLRERIFLQAELGGYLGHLSVEVLDDHIAHAAEEVAVGVGQIGVVDLRDAIVANIGIGTKGHVTQEVVAIGVHTVALDEVARIERVALRLAHLGAIGGHQKAVREDVTGALHASGHEHGRPDHAMKADDVLAYEVEVRRPEAFE